MIRPTKKSRRSGIGAFEVMLILPILLLMLLAAVQFSATLTAEDKIAEASRQAARVAAAHGDETAIHSAVRNALGTSAYNQATITVKYVHSDQNGSAGGVSVQVIVSVPTKEMAPNYLKIIGLNNDDESLTGQTIMRMESVK